MDPKLAYLSRQLNGATPVQRVAMLYDRALAALKEAIEAIGAGDIQRRWNANNLAQQIIETLWVTLDLKQGGEIAANLDRLYGFMLNHLVWVDVRNDPKPAEDVIRLLEPLRQSWHQLAREAAPAAGKGARISAAAAPAPTATSAGSSPAEKGEPARVAISA